MSATRKKGKRKTPSPPEAAASPDTTAAESPTKKPKSSGDAKASPSASASAASSSGGGSSPDVVMTAADEKKGEPTGAERIKSYFAAVTDSTCIMQEDRTKKVCFKGLVECVNKNNLSEFKEAFNLIEKRAKVEKKRTSMLYRSLFCSGLDMSVGLSRNGTENPVYHILKNRSWDFLEFVMDVIPMESTDKKDTKKGNYLGRVLILAMNELSLSSDDVAALVKQYSKMIEKDAQKYITNQWICQRMDCNKGIQDRIVYGLKLKSLDLEQLISVIISTLSFDERKDYSNIQSNFNFLIKLYRQNNNHLSNQAIHDFFMKKILERINNINNKDSFHFMSFFFGRRVPEGILFNANDASQVLTELAKPEMRENLLKGSVGPRYYGYNILIESLFSALTNLVDCKFISTVQYGSLFEQYMQDIRKLDENNKDTILFNVIDKIIRDCHRIGVNLPDHLKMNILHYYFVKYLPWIKKPEKNRKNYDKESEKIHLAFMRFLLETVKVGSDFAAPLSANYESAENIFELFICIRDKIKKDKEAHSWRYVDHCEFELHERYFLENYSEQMHKAEEVMQARRLAAARAMQEDAKKHNKETQRQRALAAFAAIAKQNPKQSTHTSSIHKSAALSAERLVSVYVNKANINLILNDVRRAIKQRVLAELKPLYQKDFKSQQPENLEKYSVDKCMSIVEMLLGPTPILSSYNPNDLEQKKLFELKSFTAYRWFFDSRMKLDAMHNSQKGRLYTLSQTIAGIWAAIHDNRFIKPADQKELEDNLFNAFAESQREYSDVADAKDRPSCADGALHNMLDVLNGKHPSIDIVRINSTTLGMYIKDYYISKFKEMPENEKRLLLQEIKAQPSIDQGLLPEQFVAKYKDGFFSQPEIQSAMNKIIPCNMTFLQKNLGHDEKNDLSELKGMSESGGNIPILVRNDNQVSLWGCVNKEWKLTPLSFNLFSEWKAPAGSTVGSISRTRLTDAMCEDIRTKNAHQFDQYLKPQDIEDLFSVGSFPLSWFKEIYTYQPKALDQKEDVGKKIKDIISNWKSSSANGMSDGYDELKASAISFGYECVDVPRDGNCFFHAVKDQIDKIAGMAKETHGSLREKAINEMLTHLPLYQQFMDENPNAFIENNGRNGTWADNLIMEALCRALRLRIVILRSDYAAPTVLQTVDSQHTIYLGYQVGVHYMSLQKQPESEFLIDFHRPSLENIEGANVRTLPAAANAGGQVNRHALFQPPQPAAAAAAAAVPQQPPAPAPDADGDVAMRPAQ